MITRIITHFARTVRAVCEHCGKAGTIYTDDHETVLCGRCWIIAHGGVPNDEAHP